MNKSSSADLSKLMYYLTLNKKEEDEKRQKEPSQLQRDPQLLLERQREEHARQIEGYQRQIEHERNKFTDYMKQYEDNIRRNYTKIKTKIEDDADRLFKAESHAKSKEYENQLLAQDVEQSEKEKAEAENELRGKHTKDF